MAPLSHRAQKELLIYSDSGARPFSMRQTYRSLKALLPQERIRFVKKEEIIAGALQQAKLLVMPGGRDVPYHEALKGEGNQQIRSFVEKGGSFLGLCAGAYYGAKEVLFEEGTPLEVKAKRELAFFPGQAIGTLFQKGLFNYEGEEGAYAAPILFKQKQLSLYYNGGCYFAEDAHYPQVQRLASYAPFPAYAAIISCQVNQGLAILSGVHIEFSAYSLKHLPFASQLAASEAERQNLFSHVLNQLLYSTAAT